MDMSTLARVLIFIGCAFVFCGVVVFILAKIPFIGKLPGDIVIKRENWSFYFPITTCIIISILLTLLMWLFGKK